MHLVSSGIEITWQLFVNARISIISTCSRVYREILTMKVLSKGRQALSAECLKTESVVCT